MDRSSTTMIEDLESRRRQLEENAAKLRKALQHWQRWEAEYEGLKEDISNLSPDARSEDLLRVSQEFESDVLDKKEIRDLLGLDKGVLRTPAQVSGLLERRIDYVQRNANGVTKQLEGVMSKIEQIDVEQRLPVDDNGDLPVADIVEELDDDDNIISSHITNPDEDKSKLTTVLEKLGAGLEPMKEPEPQQRSADSTESQSTSQSISNSASQSGSEESTSATASTAANQKLGSVESNPDPSNRDIKKDKRRRKKSVSFAEGTKAEAPAAPVFSKKHVPPGSTLDPDAQANIANVISGTFKPTDRVLELDDDDNIVAASVPEIPENESPEDARKRREMLQYSLSEVGAVVAELDIEEASTESDYSNTDTDDDEDEHGMSHSSSISDSYRAEMLALEKRLNSKTISGSDASNSKPNGATDENIAPNKSVNMGSPEKLPTSKNVRFADSSDACITEVKETKPTESKSAEAQKTSRPAVRDVISERVTDPHTQKIASRPAEPGLSTSKSKKSSSIDASSEPPPAKVSRFKASRKN